MAKPKTPKKRSKRMFFIYVYLPEILDSNKAGLYGLFASKQAVKQEEGWYLVARLDAANADTVNSVVGHYQGIVKIDGSHVPIKIKPMQSTLPESFVEFDKKPFPNQPSLGDYMKALYNGSVEKL